MVLLIPHNIELLHRFIIIVTIIGYYFIRWLQTTLQVILETFLSGYEPAGYGQLIRTMSKSHIEVPTSYRSATRRNLYDN